MAKRERNMAGISFDNVAKEVGTAGTEKVTSTPSANEEATAAPRKKESGSKLKSLINEKKSTTQVGFHIENDLHEVLKKLQEQNGRGTNSKIVNELLRELFEEEGLL